MDTVQVPKRVVDLLALIRKDGVIQRASELQEVYRLLAAHSAGAQATPVYPQGVMGIPPWTPPGHGEARANDALTYNAAQPQPMTQTDELEALKADNARLLDSLNAKSSAWMEMSSLRERKCAIYADMRQSNVRHQFFGTGMRSEEWRYAMSTQTQRERFEAWKCTVPPVHREEIDCMWAAWKAAQTDAIERCAKVCDEWQRQYDLEYCCDVAQDDALKSAALAIRALLPKEE